MSQQADPNQFTTPFLLTKASHRNPYPAISPSNPANSQKGKIIIITGASAGIGEAAAKVWAEAKASGIVIAARSFDTLLKVKAKLESISPETKVLAVKTDIASEESVKNLFVEVQKTFGRPADVLLNNAGHLDEGTTIAETSPDQWWKTMEINVKGVYSMVHHYIQSQPDPKNPVGTIIAVSSGRAGITGAGGSSYNISKLAEERLGEHLQIESPTLRVFSTMPGIVATGMVNDFWKPFAIDHADLTGMLALYLVQPRADYLKGSMVGVNWDVEEMEKYKDEIESKGLLKTSWLPILPFNGGSGLAGLKA